MGGRLVSGDDPQVGEGGGSSFSMCHFVLVCFDTLLRFDTFFGIVCYWVIVGPLFFKFYVVRFVC